MATKYRLLKQFIPAGQPGDPSWAQRNIYVLQITSGSYSGSNDLYDTLESVYLAQDQLSQEEQSNYQGWGVLGDGRYFLKIETNESGSITEKIDKPKIIKEKEVFKVKKETPIFLSFSPAQGNIGDTIRVSGSHFYGCYRVDFNKTPATGSYFDNPNDDVINLIIPPNVITGQLKIYKYDNTSIKSGINFVVTSTPQITPSIVSFSPTSGTVATLITISGSDLEYTNIVTFFDNVPASFDVVDTNTMTVTVPSGANDGFIMITDFDNEVVSSSQTFDVLFPTGVAITGFTPSYGIVGTVVTINGVDFVGSTDVAFNGTSSAFTVANDNQITTTAPAYSAYGKISVTNGTTAYSANNFVVQKGTSAKVPTIDSFSPISGPVGTLVHIVGKEFIGTISVQFNGTYVTSFYVIDDKNIDAIVPVGASTGDIIVTNNLGSDNRGTFTVT
jgi:hypothetical protein